MPHWGAAGQGASLSTTLFRRSSFHQEGELRPFRDANGRKFTEEQRQWLELIRDYIASSLVIEPGDFDYVPFAQHGGIGKAYQVFGKGLQPLLEELNETLAA